MDGEVEDQEHLAVFVLDSAKMTRTRVKWRAIIPDDDDGERSFFRTAGLQAQEIHNIWQQEVAPNDPQHRALKGWADLTAECVRGCEPLTAEKDEPPDRHGVIRGWPDEPQKR